MMQQPNPMQAQGIGALLSGMPQGKPMGSPRAAIGSVQDRVEAYRPNPNMLEQQAGVSGDLLDLMAMQKLKAEKEAAMRSLTLQQGAQQGQPPTIAQQREEELKQMTKQELAPQVAQTAQKQEQDKQALMQRLMAGIAGAPNAGQVMPQRMAGGGVVAFQNLGEVPNPEAIAMDEARVAEAAKKRKVAELAKQLEFLKSSGAPESQTAPLERQIAALMGAPQAPQAPQPSQAPRPPQTVPRRPPMPTQPGPGLASTPAGRGMTMPGAAPSQPQMPTQLGQSMETGPVLSPEMRQTPPEEGGLAGLLKSTGIDPAKDAERIRARAQEVYGVRPEQRAPLESEVERLKKGLEPKETRWYDRLAELAPYLSEQRIRPGDQGIAGGLGRFASASADLRKTQKGQTDAQRKQLIDLQTKLADMDQSAKAKVFEAELGAETRGREAQRGMGQLGATLKGIDTTATTATSDREARERMTKLELDARASEGEKNRASEIVRARIAAASANRPGETERMIGVYERLRARDPKAADEYLGLVERFRGAGRAGAQNIAELKALQESLQAQMKNYALPQATRDAAAAQLKQVNDKLGESAGLGKAPAPALYANNPKTGERIMSTDGGQTWQPAR